MSCFKLPQGVLKQIGRHTRKFFWSSGLDRNKIPWIPWDTILKPKKEGGLGLRDLNDFNLALLAKQGWRMMKNPNSLLARLYKAKYFPKTNLLSAILGVHPSHAWRSIMEGNKVLKEEVYWQLGNGENIHIWDDNWVPAAPHRPPTKLPTFQVTDHNLKVKDLFIRGTRIWDVRKLSIMFSKEDVECIKRIQPSVRSQNDFLSWRYTRSGLYNVKSGYYVARRENMDQSNGKGTSKQGTLRNIYNKIWSLPIPPKVRHFWWRVLHEALPTGINLSRKRIPVSPICCVCKEKEESVKHLLFTCRVAKEIWELTALRPIPLHWEEDETTIPDIITELLRMESPCNHIFVHLGWNLWKARNHLLYNKNRIMIPQIIHKSYLDYLLWQEAKNLGREVEGGNKNSTRIQQMGTTVAEGEICCVDASWKSESEHCGYGWSIIKADGSTRVIGSGCMSPLPTPLAAEAMALRITLSQIRSLGISAIGIHSDSQQLIHWLQLAQGGKESGNDNWIYHPIAPIITDILYLGTRCHFSHVPRHHNVLADQLAKKARARKSNSVVKWIL